MAILGHRRRWRSTLHFVCPSCAPCKFSLGAQNGGGLRPGSAARVRFDLPERDFQVVRHAARCQSRAADELLSIVTAPFASWPRRNRIRAATPFVRAKAACVRGSRDARRMPYRGILRAGCYLPSVAEKVWPSTSVSCMYLRPAIVPEAGAGNVTVAAAPILARIPKGPGSNLL
jgi:hypothetical protein